MLEIWFDINVAFSMKGIVSLYTFIRAYFP
jgi:hypothetical protein